MVNNFALIIGAMKCGTTSLFSYLAQHPQISACSEKEPKFFTNTYKWNRGFEWYQNLWNWNPPEHKIALEASTSYTRIPIRPNAAERISTLREKACFKFIYIVRNPIERIESHYTHGLSQGWAEAKQPISSTISREFIEVSRYTRQIEEYYKRFSSDSILLLDFEDLKTNPLDLLKNICHFLDVDPDYAFQALNKRHNANNQRLKDERLWESMSRIKPFYSVAKLIPAKQKQMIYSCFGRKRKDSFKLSPEQQNFVLAELQEDLRKLSFKYGVDVSRWGIKL